MEKEEVQKLVDEKIKAEFSAFAEKQKKEFDELKAMFGKEHHEEPKNEPKNEPTDGEHHEEPKEHKEAEFAAMVSKAVADGIAQAMQFGKEVHEEPKRKTKVEFGSYKQLDNKKKTVMEMSAEIDNNPNLTPEQKWAEQAKLWREHQDEFQKM